MRSLVRVPGLLDDNVGNPRHDDESKCPDDRSSDRVSRCFGRLWGFSDLWRVTSHAAESFDELRKLPLEMTAAGVEPLGGIEEIFERRRQWLSVNLEGNHGTALRGGALELSQDMVRVGAVLRENQHKR